MGGLGWSRRAARLAILKRVALEGDGMLHVETQPPDGRAERCVGERLELDLAARLAERVATRVTRARRAARDARA